MKKIFSLLIVPVLALGIGCSRENKIETNRCKTCEDFIGTQPYIYAYTKYDGFIYRTCRTINDKTILVTTHYFEDDYDSGLYLTCEENKK